MTPGGNFFVRVPGGILDWVGLCACGGQAQRASAALTPTSNYGRNETMKQTTKMSRAVSQLEHIFNTLNTDFFDGMLPVPIITVQSQPGTMGHTSVAKIWKRGEDNTYELNIAAEVLDYNIEETLDTMLHEMVHMYCRENGIKECSRGGSYHNKRFKEEAERRGLTCYYTKQYGWNTTP